MSLDVQNLNVLVTGAAGFIGSNLVDRLLAMGARVTGYDNLSTGVSRYLDDARTHAEFRFVNADVLDTDTLAEALKGIDWIVHFAANADVRFGPDYPTRDLEQNTIATSSVLQAMRAAGLNRISFASTSAVYGEPSVTPIPEDCPFPVQTSLYGASKCAAEGLISSYCEAYDFRATVFRFASVLGERYCHGHVYDFYAKLKANPAAIEVLGNGQQRKAYVHVGDVIDAILLAEGTTTSERYRPYNIGSEAVIAVDESLRQITNTLGLDPERQYTGGERGWVGDNPLVHLDCRKLLALGWEPKKSPQEAVVATVEWLRDNEWIFAERAGVM